MKKTIFIIILLAVQLYARPVHLTLNKAVNIAMNNSFRTRHLEYEIRKDVHYLKARQAGLKTQVYMDLRSPDIQNISDYKWNSVLRRDEIIHQNTSLWQSDLSIRQPIQFFGYPTNGNFSINYKIYRYTQIEEEARTADVYNRLYLKFEQPFFLPNEQKNDLEEAELNLRSTKLSYIRERVEIMEDISDDYYEIFELTYMNQLLQDHLDLLESIRKISEKIATQEENRSIEKTQVELEFTNIREIQLDNNSDLRKSLTDLHLALRLEEMDSIIINPEILIHPIKTDETMALQHAYEMHPYLEQLRINRRHSEIDVDEAEGDNSFHMSLKMTYGLEKKNHRLSELWDQFDNSNSVTINAYLPLWDGGERKHRIQAEEQDIHRQDLRITEEKEDMRNDIMNALTNVRELYERATNMQKSAKLSHTVTESSIAQYADDKISLQGLLQIVNRDLQTQEKLLSVFIDFREALLTLTTETYYNFEKDISLFEEFELAFDE